jgi:ABC-type branched-subunit amino acid transport system substrate-binding protein
VNHIRTNLKTRWAALGLATCAVIGTSVTLTGAAAGAATPKSSSTYPIMIINSAPTPGNNYTLGAAAEVAAVNAKGGIDGHKLSLLFCDSGAGEFGDPNTTAGCGTEAVQKHALAIVGSFTGYDNTLYPTTDKAKIANIGEQPVAAQDNTDPGSFAFVGSPLTIYAAQGYQLAKAGCKQEVILATAGLASNSLYQQGFTAGAKFGGGKALPLVTVSQSTVDYAPTVAQLKSEGVDCIADGLASITTVPALIEDMHTAGGMTLSLDTAELTPQDLTALKNVSSGVIGANTALEGAMSTDADPVTSQEKTMVATIKKYEPSGISENGLEWINYAAVKVLEAAISKIDASGETLDSANVWKTLNGLTVSTGIYPTIDFAKAGGAKIAPRLFNTDDNFFNLAHGELTPMFNAENFDVAPALNAS